MSGIIGSMRKTTESSVAMQQELFDKWVHAWPWVPVSVFPFGELQKTQRKGVEMVGELMQRQNNLFSVQLKMGFETMDRLFHLAEVKDPQQLRSWTMEMWQKAFDDLWLISNAQMRTLQNAVDKLISKEPRPADRSIPMPVAKETRPGSEPGVKRMKVKSDREELKEALEEYEMTKGDWSKGH
jgi:hypothetical protein